MALSKHLCRCHCPQMSPVPEPTSGRATGTGLFRPPGAGERISFPQITLVECEKKFRTKIEVSSQRGKGKDASGPTELIPMTKPKGGHGIMDLDTLHKLRTTYIFKEHICYLISR